MQRRTFLKALGAGVALGSQTGRLYAGEATTGVPDLVAVKNGDPEALFDQGIEALGGHGALCQKGPNRGGQAQYWLECGAGAGR